MDEERRVCQTPTPGRQGTRIIRWKYDLVRGAILKSVPRKGEGVLFKELQAKVAGCLTAQEKQALGSIGWYTTVVKLDMEVNQELKRIPGSTPQRLLRAK